MTDEHPKTAAPSSNLVGELREHIRKGLYAPSGTRICACRIVYSGECYYCQGAALLDRSADETSGESRQPPIKVDAENTFLQLTNNSGAPLTIVGTESVTLRPGESWPPDKTADPSLLEASQRVSAMALSAAGKHAERVVELEAEVATLREHLAEQNRLLSLNVAEVKRLKALGSPVETTAPREGIRPTTLDPTRSWAEQMNASAEKAWEPTTVEILEYARRYSLSTEEARKLLKAERASMIGAVKTKVIPCVWQSGCKNHRICDEMGCCQQLGAENGTALTTNNEQVTK